MATLAELRELYPSVYQGKSDFAAVKLLADARQASLPLVAYELGLNPEDYYQNESNSQDFGTDLAIGGAEAVRGVAGIANIAAAPFTDEQLITTPGLDEYIQRQQATMSPNRQRAQGELDQAWEDGGFWNILGEYASEPAYLTGMGLQSAPAMVGGGVGGMALRGAARLGAGALARGLGAAAPYIGEGAIAGGMDYAQMVEQGVDPQVAAGYGALAGAGVGALGGVGGAFANRMGITDVSRALSGARRVDGDVPLSYGRQLGYGSLNEAGQEILQSPWEQAMQNLATDQPVTEGLARSAVEGGILGGVMGAGFNAMPRGRGRELDLTQDRDNTQGLVNPAQPFAGVPGGNTTPESPQARRQADLEAAFGAADQNLGLSSGHFDANLGRELTLGELPSEVYDPKLGRNLTHAELITNPDYQGTVAKPTAPKAAAAPKASPPENPTLAALRQRYADNPTWPTKGLLSTKGAVLPGFAKTRLPALQVIIGQNTPEEAIKRLRVEQDAVNQKKGDLAPHVSRLIDVLIAEQEAKLASQGQTTSAKADTAGTVPEGNGLAPQAKTTSVMPAQETPAPAAPQDDLGEFPPYPGPAAETGTSLADLAARNQPKPKAATAEKDLTKDAAPTGTEGLIADAAQAEALPTTQAPKQTNQKLVIDDADADHQARFDATLDQVATKRNIPPPARAVLADLMQRYFRIGKYHEYSGVQPPSYTSMAAALNDSGYAVSHTTAGILAKEFQDLYAAELERQGKPVEYFDPQAMAWTGTLDDGNQRGTRSLDATAEEFNAEQGYGRDELVDAEQGVDGLGDVSSEADAVLATGTDDLGQFGNARSGDATLNAIGEADATANDPQDDADIDEELGYQLGGIGSKADAAAGGIGGADAVSARPRVVKFYADRHLFAANKYREARGEPPLTPKQAKAELSKLSDVALGRHLDRLTKAGISGKRLADVNDPKPKLVDAYAALQDDLAALGTGALRGEKSGRTVVELETPDTSVAVSGAVGAWQQATRSIPNAPALDTLSPELFTLWEKAHNGALELPDFHREAWLRNFARDLINERDTQSKRGVVAGTAAQPQASDAAGTAPRPTDAENLSESGSAQPELATGGREVEAPAGVGTVVSENRNTSAAKDAADRAAKIAARKAAAKAAQGAAANLSRQGGTARSGQTVAAVEGWIAQAKAKLAPWVQNGIQVVQSVDDLRAALPNQGIPDDAVGAHSNGKVYLVADQIGSSRQALRTLAHEVVGHLGLERLLGNDFADLVDKVARHLQANVKVVADVAAEVKRRYGDLSPTEQTKEIMALLAERQPNFGLVREVLAKLRVWLAKHGLGSLEAAELNQLLVNAARTVRGKGATSAGASPTAPTLARTGDTRTRYEARIDELFAGAPAARVGAKVLDRSDMLDMLGYGGKPVVLREAKVLLSEDNHAAMTAAQWKKIPEWIDNPVAVFDSDTVAGRLVLVAPEAINGAPVFIIMEPNARENTLDTHLLVNAYDATGGRTPVSRWLKDGKLRYINNEKSPALSDTSWLQLPRVYRQIPGSKVKILTERNLVKYREANPLPGQDTVNFQRGTDDTLPAFKTAQGWLKQEFKSGKAVGEGRGLGWLTMEQIAERYGDQVPALRAINTAIGTMEAQAKKWVGKAEHIDRLWQQLSKAQDKLMSEIMIAATLAGYDPDGGKTKTKGVTTPEEAALDRQWQHLQALDKGAKVPATSVYRAVRNHFEQDLGEVKAHLKDLKGKERTPQVEALIGALEGLSKGSTKPYFPLMRLGGYYTVGRSPELQALHVKRGANDDGLSKDEEKRYDALRKDAKHYVVASHARLANAERHRDKLLAQGMTAFANTAQERGAKHRSSIVEDMKTFDNAIKDLKLDAGVKKQLEQVYESLLISSLPEGHVLKKSLRRDGVIGADTDMRRVVATSANSRAYALSRLQHARDVQESLGELRAASADGNMTERNLANEMVRRTNLAYEHYQDSPIITAMTTASYMGMLGASPAFWLINLTQVPLITAPWLAARTNKGFTATMRDLGVAAKQASQMIKWTTDGQWRAEFKLDNPPKGVTADELKMFRALEDAGQLDFTLAFDLGQVAAGKSGKFWNVLRSVNAPTNATELINRGGTALAAYRAKRGQGVDHEAAVEFAKQATNTTQINYNPANAARYMQTAFGLGRGPAKIMFQFYTYQQGMAYLALSTLKDAVAGDKTAMKTMGYMTGTLVAMSGVFGLPFVSTLLSAASMALTKLGDDDEPVDLEVWLKNLMHDTIPGLDVLASKGAPAALLGIDLSSRTGQGNLMNPLAYARFGAKDRGEDTIQELMFRIFGGASAGTASGIVDGVMAIAEGDLLKGIEKIGPLKAVKDLAKFAQLQEGGVRTGSGEQALGAEAFHAGNLLAQAMGFSPTKKSLYYEGNAAVQNVKQAVDGVRTKLLSRYAQAFIAGKGFTDVHKEIREFNQRHPERKISWTSMTQSVKQRRTNRQERLPSGVAGGKDNQPFQQYGRFAQ